MITLNDDSNPAHSGTHAETSSSSSVECRPEAASTDSAREAAYDAGLVERFRSGHEQAFVEIMERYRGRIFGLARHLLRNTSDAEEITQDTFIRAHRGLAKFRGDSSLATWLYRIALNLSRNRYWYFFRRRRQDSISLELSLGHDSSATFSDLVAAESRNPLQETVTREFADLVARCMEKLDPVHREILTMRNILNLPYEEIAAAIGINVGTVKSRIARARENLRRLMVAEAPEFGPEPAAPSDFFEHSRTIPGCLAITYA
ncbi:MAG: sigma-70 family RNA polymerase sigma factor [Opitutaceae bacterium]|jgi:RNA polymerase sigma-70 factor (ECF subfamily)|nr:sigma-70 family RNA polymerase sigma factor [Opitutaceae bacterium]